MIRDRSQARLVELMDELLGSSLADYGDEIVRQAATTRQRPGWTFPSRWLPSAMTELPAWPATSRARDLIVLATVALLVLALTWIALVGSQRRFPAPFGLAGNGQLAYASAGEIWVADSTANTPRLLIGGPESDNIPIYSPLGDRIAFLRHPDPTGTVGDFFLMVADSDGSDVLQLSGPISGLNGFAWSPDQSVIAFGHSVNSISAIVLYPTIGGAPANLDLGVPAEWLSFRPPSGGQVAFLGLVRGRWEIHVANADGSLVRNLGLAGSPPSWKPDGRSLAFDVADDGTDPEGAKVRINIADVGPACELVGRRRLEFDPRNEREVGGFWSPDGQWLAFVRVRVGRSVVAIGRPDGTGYREIGVETPDASVTSVWAWAPDGRSIFQTYDDGATWLLDPGGGPPRRASLGDGGFTSWQRVALQ